MTPAPDPNKIPKSQRRNPADSALDYVGLVNDSVQAGFERLAAAQEKTLESMERGFEKVEVAMIQSASQIKQTNVNIRELSDEIKLLRGAIADHLQLAQQQAQNIQAQQVTNAELTRLVATLLNKVA